MKKSKVDQTRILAVLVIILSILYFYLNLFSPHTLPNFLRVGSVRRPINLLIFGTDLNYDSETGKPIAGMVGRTDTLILAHLDPARGQINLLSIPRDTLVTIPGYGMAKINAANVYGGKELEIETVRIFTHKPIDYYIGIDIGSFIRLVDMLGGVNLYVEKNMRYIDRAQKLNIDLTMGWQKLSGEKAHEYIRFRHDAEGDIGRIQRQQNFLRALLITLIRPSNLLKSPYAIWFTLKDIKTNLAPTLAIRIFNFARMSRVKAFSVAGESTMVDGVGSVWIPDKQEMKKILDEYF